MRVCVCARARVCELVCDGEGACVWCETLVRARARACGVGREKANSITEDKVSQ